ncbi:TIGR03086 family metal-binding protein [Catellatospora sp. KI3]|uniref:TIGR03086 family metal-binding protein n=1 Tax=Catellatospora sp. KI3 TaxID=3041620 RepID=UPI0024828817|nr:TIGR03086 family metal-binding protein [Catellatospora sp. KI3]MDI1461571.1 TIGR03086 family metal-binding protein [Catellatospora sp. KI3]
MTIDKLITKAAGTVTGVLTESALSGLREAPTPCADYDVHGLCQHMLGSIYHSRAAALRQPGPEQQPVMDAPPWVKFPPELVSLSEAWSSPGALDGELEIVGRRLPAEFGAGITLMELVLHGWDLARASGQEIRFDDDVVARALAQVERMAVGMRANGGFGPEVPVPGDAAPMDRLLGVSGRDPHWKP